MSQKGDDGSQFENYALTLLAAKMVLCEQGNIDIGRCSPYIRYCDRELWLE